MVKLFQELYPETTPSEERVWENPDPRIQWALDILEPPGGEMRSLASRIAPPLGGAIFGFGFVATRNYVRKIPLRSNILGYAALTLGGFLGGDMIERYLREKRAENLAIYKHYIMLHPERFPEPEKMKIGDKRVFYSWPIHRKGHAS